MASLPSRQKVSETLLDAFFPPRCGGCSRFSKAMFCEFCRPRLRRLGYPRCRICGMAFDPNTLPAPECADCRANRYHAAPAFAAARSLYYFEGPLRDAVHRFKYAECTSLAAGLGGEIADLVRTDLVFSAMEFAAVVPVPLHPIRRWRRGFNQSELLAEAFARRTGVPMVPLLGRPRLTPTQVGLSKVERAANVRGIFEADSARLERSGARGRPVLVIDDVFTTGATLAECARTLRKAGTGPVYAVTVAREA